jgi:hypothetical protein
MRSMNESPEKKDIERQNDFDRRNTAESYMQSSRGQRSGSEEIMKHAFWMSLPVSYGFVHSSWVLSAKISSITPGEEECGVDVRRGQT